MNKYYLIEDIINLYMEEPYKSICLNVLVKYADKINIAYGSINNHQSWPGGYRDHVVEVLNIAILLFNVLNSTGRTLPFTLSQALFILFWHDMEKPWKYEAGPSGKLQHILPLKTKAQAKLFREELLKSYSLELTSEEKNALTYVEGESDDYSPLKRVMGSLAAFCHLCDVTSARIWPNYPKDNDSWLGASRFFKLDERK